MDIKIREARVGTEGKTRTWRLGYVDAAEKDARKFLNEDQYAHAVQLFDELALEENPRLSRTQDVRPIDDFYELRDKGGVLGRINLRVYFAVFDEHCLILAVCAYKKEDEGQTPPHIIVKVRNRLRIAQKLIPGSIGR
jgi:hypothetical protein